MQARLAHPEEAETLWHVRNAAIRHGCRDSYDADLILAYTPDAMPPTYREYVANNPFYVVDGPDGTPVSTGYLSLSNHSIEAIFTMPEFTRKGMASLIVDTLLKEARRRQFMRITLAALPNAASFYEKRGFVSLGEAFHWSGTAQANLRCVDMEMQL